MDKKTLELKISAANSRLNVMRMLRAGGSGHVGGAFSAIDIVTALYFSKMNVDPKDPKMPVRDRFILSAGHKCLAQYAVLAEKGFFPKEYLDTYGSLGTKLPGHPDMHKLPGIEANTGALGHGLSIAVGMALGLRLEKKPSNVYVVMGDGELPEGSNWEAAAAAAHYKLDNLTVFVDYNGLQISGDVHSIMDMSPIDEHFAAFGWETVTIDGNDMDEIVKTLDRVPFKNGKPTLVLMKTVKAKGIKKGEGVASYHYWSPKKEELDEAEADLAAEIKGLAEALKAVK